MPDKRSRTKERRRTEWYINARRLRLYTDEDVDDWAAFALRSAGINVLTTREAGNAGKDDASQATYAKRQRRVLLTRNVKHFWHDNRLPFHSTRGVIGLDVDPGDTEGYIVVLMIVAAYLTPWAEIYEHSKIKVSPSGITSRFVDRAGRHRESRLGAQV